MGNLKGQYLFLPSMRKIFLKSWKESSASADINGADGIVVSRGEGHEALMKIMENRLERCTDGFRKGLLVGVQLHAKIGRAHV